MPLLSTRQKGTLLTTLGVLVLTPDGLLVRLIDLDAWSLLFWRGCLFGLTISLFYLATHRKSFLSIFTSMGNAGLLAAACFTSSTLFFVQSLHNTSVANTLVLIATAPLFAALLGRVFLKEKLDRATWIAILVSILGIAFIFSESLSGANLIGDIFALCAALSLAGQITTVRSSPSTDMVPSLIVSGVAISVIALLFGASTALPEGDNFYLILILGCLVLPLSFALITIGPRYIPAAEVSLLMLLEIFLGPLWVWLIVHEKPANETLAGGILVLTTLAVHTVYTSRSRKTGAQML